MAASKPKGKKGKKGSFKQLSKLGNVGMKKAPTEKGEVSGKTSLGAFYICHCDGCVNFIPFGWDFFLCHCDGCFNTV